MARIEVITELLVNEIESFNKSIEILKKQTNELKNIDFRSQTDHINIYFENNFKQLENIQNNQLSKLTEALQVRPKNSNLKLFIVLSLALLALSMGNVFYAKNLMEKEAIAVKAKKEIKEHIINFFTENPKAQKAYNKWNKK